MAQRIFFEHTKTGKRYEVLGFDEANGTVTLKGVADAFNEPFNRERFEKMGYKLVREDIKAEVESD